MWTPIDISDIIYPETIRITYSDYSSLILEIPEPWTIHKNKYPQIILIEHFYNADLDLGI